MEPYLIESIVTLLMIACMVAILAQWIKQPYTIALVIVGLVVALTKLMPDMHISHDVTFTLILPPLLFQGALHMDLANLKDNWRSIAMLAVPGVVCTTFLIGLILNKFIGLEWMYALLFGALITPTDPISVLSILKKAGAPHRLRAILEGESLFNDGTGVVVFTIILGLITGGGHFNLGHTLGKFLIVTGGGALIGVVIGYIAYRILKQLDDHLLEVAITVVLTFGTPLLAEHFHFSGIIAIVVAGLIIGNYGRIYSMSPKTRETLETFWEVIDFIINSLLFLIIGIELQEINKDQLFHLWGPIFITIFTVIFARFIVVYPIIWFRNRIAPNDIPKGWTHVLFWAGLKGSISIALVVGLPQDFVYRSYFLCVAFSVVLFSLIVQAMTMKPLIKYLGLSSENE